MPKAGYALRAMQMADQEVSGPSDGVPVRCRARGIVLPSLANGKRSSPRTAPTSPSAKRTPGKRKWSSISL